MIVWPYYGVVLQPEFYFPEDGVPLQSEFTHFAINPINGLWPNNGVVLQPELYYICGIYPKIGSHYIIDGHILGSTLISGGQPHHWVVTQKGGCVTT